MVRIEGEITFETVAAVKTAIAEENGKTVEVFIDSIGGDVDSTIDIRRALLSVGVSEVTVGDRCYSCAANLLASLKANGAKVVVSPYSEIMYHSAYLPMAFDLSEDKAKSLSEMLAVVNAEVKADLSKLGIDCADWFNGENMKWIGAREAVEIGLADEMDFETGMEAGASAKLTECRLCAKLNGERIIYTMAKKISKQAKAAEEVKPDETDVKTEPVAETEDVEKTAEEVVEKTEPTEEVEKPAEEVEALKARIAELEKEIEELKTAKAEEEKPAEEVVKPCAALARPAVKSEWHGVAIQGRVFVR